MSNNVDIFTGDGVVESENELISTLDKVKHKAPWVAKWRPKSIQELILPDRIKNMLEYGLQNNEFTHMILHSGKPGTGKTSTSIAIPTQLNTEYDIYAGAESNSDIFDSIRAFASQKLTNNKSRFVIIDEADRPKAQDAAKFYNGLNSLIEATEGTLRFILTCNNLYKISESIRSRCSPISFAYDVNDVSLKKQLFNRMKHIANEEVTKKGGTVDKDTLANIAKHYYPDIRSIIQAMFINYLENKGNIIGTPTLTSQNHVDSMWSCIQCSDFTNLRKYVSANIVDFQSMYFILGEYIINQISDQNKLNFAVLLAEYQYRASMPAVDQEINMNGFLAKTIMLLNKG
jgi:DNA polymerase III delta prime subunit